MPALCVKLCPLVALQFASHYGTGLSLIPRRTKTDSDRVSYSVALYCTVLERVALQYYTKPFTVTNLQTVNCVIHGDYPVNISMEHVVHPRYANNYTLK